MRVNFTFAVDSAHIEVDAVVEDKMARVVSAVLLEERTIGFLYFKGKKYSLLDLARWETAARFCGMKRCDFTGLASPYLLTTCDGRYTLSHLAVEDHNGKTRCLLECQTVNGKIYHNSELEKCPVCGRQMVKGEWCRKCQCKTVDGEILPKGECAAVKVKTHDGWDFVYVRKEKSSDYPYCSDCGCHVFPDYWRSDFQICEQCERKVLLWDGDDEDDFDERQEIWPYHEAPQGRRDKMKMYGKGKSRFGWELEIGGASRSSDPHCVFNNLVAKNMKRTSGIEDGEVWFERDGSIACIGGFEIISAPHTVKDFWAKRDKWAKMLDYLSSKGFKSHETGCCGLHVHVGREMLGDTTARQNMSIAKIFKFYEEHWEDLEKASRRTRFSYCNKAHSSRHALKSSVQVWKLTTQHHRNGETEDGDTSPHHLALNNSNSATFEFRLGRGTLNKASFFAWIDLCLAIARNARKITIAKANGAKTVDWLRGIKAATARYLLRRGAFVDAVKALFPEVAWEDDARDDAA
jgi:hypothetical protein